MWGRFDQVEANVTDEVRDLYRIRDNDAQYANSPASLVDLNNVGLNREALDNSNYNKVFSIKPTDPIWLRMTESERIENGLPTRQLIFFSSVYGIGLSFALTSKINIIITYKF